MIPGIIAWRRAFTGLPPPVVNTWYMEKEFYGETSGSNFSEAISISPNNTYLAASHHRWMSFGVEYEGVVKLYKNINNDWVLFDSPMNPDFNNNDLLAYRRFGQNVVINNEYFVTTAFDRDLNRNKVYVFLIEPTSEETYRFVTSFHSPDHVPTQNFGWSLALSNNKLSIGTATGNTSSGKVFVYDLTQTSATLVQTLIPSALQSPDLENSKFGSTLKAFGDTLLVGAPSDDETLSGVYIYTLTGGNYVEGALITSPDTANQSRYRFGLSLDISEKYLIIGSPYTAFQNGKVFVYEKVTGNWVHSATLDIPETTNNAGIGEAYTGVVLNGPVYFGKAVSVYQETLLIGANFDNGNSSINGGVVYLFQKDQTTLQWVQSTKIYNPITTDAGYFGSQVINLGDTLFVGAWANDQYIEGIISDVDLGSLHIYRKGTPTYRQDQLPSVITTTGLQAFTITQDTQSATVNTVRIPVTLIQNQAIRFGTTNIFGSSHDFDTYIRLLDSGLNTVVENDDYLNSEGNIPAINTAELGVNWVNDNGSFIYYLVPASGTYYMDIGGFDIEIGSGTVAWEILS